MLGQAHLGKGTIFLSFWVALLMTDAPSTCLGQSVVRVATYNVSLYASRQGQLLEKLNSGKYRPAINVAKVIRHVRPDVLLLCEIDHDAKAEAVNQFCERYLNHSDPLDADPPISYPYRWSIPSNTGLDSGMDLNGDGSIQIPDDAFGFGRYPGQYAMAVLSRFPIDRQASRTFQKFPWSRMPEALKPVHPDSGRSYYAAEVWKRLRLSSKNHADVVIRIGGEPESLPCHFLVCHPTPPVFDGKDDHNGCRNHDEIRFWTEYLREESPDALMDDHGIEGGLPSDASFVIAGDLNSDPEKGDSRQEAIRQLLRHPRVQDPRPLNSDGDPNTAAFFHQDGQRGMRVDYVLPSADWTVRDCGVFWPRHAEPLNDEVGASDHRMVWVDLVIERHAPAGRP